MTLPEYNALTASARIMPAKKIFEPKYERWQDELWDYYDRLGELESAVGWKANTMSRVRLVAAELSTTGDEPTPIEEGPAADAMARLAGGTGGQAQIMKEATIHLGVPGIGWLTGETKSENEEEWTFRSADELRVAGAGSSARYEVREDEDSRSWRPLSPESIVVRIWDPHPRFGWRPDSAARHAMGAMLELDLINKRIIAQILSRLASNGILLYDKDKLSFPPQEPPEDGSEPPDPFAATLVDVAQRAINDPTSPQAAIPIPIGFNLQDLTDVDPKSLLQHITVADFIDDKLLAERDSAVKRLATSLDMPAEILLGMGDVNHWSAWQIEESGLKIHIAPTAELITHGLTVGYLIPALKAAGADLVGPNGGRIVVWYDPSEVTVRPDRSESTRLAYDRGEVSGRVYRREIGLSESDAPTPEEFREWLTKFLARQPVTGATMLQGLGGPNVIPPDGDHGEPGEIEAPDEDEGSADPADRLGPPDTQEEPPPPPDQDAAMIRQLVMSIPEDELAVLLNERFPELAGQPTNGWVEADVPVGHRVTPKRRSDADGNGDHRIVAPEFIR